MLAKYLSGRRAASGQSGLGELDPQRRHAGQAGDLLLGAGAHDVAGQEIVEQHHLGANGEGGGELAQAGVEAERQHRENAVVAGVLQVLADAPGARHHVAMGEHHALGIAGAAGGVEDGGHVRVDDPARLAGAGCGDRLLPAQQPRTDPSGLGAAVIDRDHRGEIGTLRDLLHEIGDARARGHQHPHIAVAEDIADLARLQQGVDRHEDAAGGRGGEHRDHGLQALLQIDPEALAAPEAEGREAASRLLDALPQAVIVEDLAPIGHGGTRRHALRRVSHQLVQQFTHGREASRWNPSLEKSADTLAQKPAAATISCRIYHSLSRFTARLVNDIAMAVAAPSPL